MSTGIDIKKKLAILEEGANITTDATSIDFVGSGVNSSSVGGNVTVNIPGGSGTTTYYLNESVTQTPYKEFSSIATNATEQIIPLTASAGATSVIAEYLTPTGVPGTTQIPTGLWQFFLHFNAGATGQNWIIRPEVYKRDLGGIETLLLTLDPVVVTNMSTTTTMYVSDAVFPFTTILTTDRILVRISMQNTTGVSQTVNFRTEGNQHYSVGLTTLNQVIPTNAVTSVTGTAPVVSSGGTTPAISMPVATSLVNGYLSSSDWSVFSAKQSAITLTTTGSSGASTFITNTLNVPTYTLSGLGGVPSSRSITINGTTLDLSANRTWNVGTVTGTGTINRLSKWISSTELGNSLIEDDGTSIGIGVAAGGTRVKIQGNTTYAMTVENTFINGMAAQFYSTAGGNNVGIQVQAGSGTTGGVVGIQSIIAGGTVGQKYAIQLQDGTENIGKVLTCIASDGKANWVTPSTGIPQANTIYVDSVNGVNAATGRGDINTPYLTPEYALGNITNTGTITATTTNTSATLTAVSDTTNIKIGQYITGTGIPYESIVVSKTINTIVLSKACTASATITATWWTVYDVMLIGDFTVTSNIYKNGFYIDAKMYNTTISFGAFTLFQLTSNAPIPVVFKLGRTYGTSASSSLHNTGAFSGISCSIDHGNYYSLGTSFQYSNGNGHFNYSGNVTIVGEMFDCRFGSISYFYNIGGVFKWDSDAYALLGGIRGGGSFTIINGNITTPTSINALYGIGSNYVLYGNITGSVQMTQTTLGQVSSIYANMRGTTITIDGGNVGKTNVFGSIVGNVVCTGIVGLYGYVSGNISVSSPSVTCVTIFNGSDGTITVTGGTVIYDYAAQSYSSFFNTISIGDGVFINNGVIRCSLSYTSTGKFINNGTIFTDAATGTAPRLIIDNGGTLINNPNGVIRYDGLNVAALITKTNGKLINNGRMVNTSRLYVNYNANTSASKDIIIQNSYTNGNGANGGVSKGTSNILYINTTMASTDTSATLYDGTNTVTISVVGAGKTVAQINTEMVTLIKASVLKFQCCEILVNGFVFFLGLQSIVTTATSLINMTSGTYNVGGGLSFVPNALVYGTEINDYNLNY